SPPSTSSSPTACRSRAGSWSAASGWGSGDPRCGQALPSWYGGSNVTDVATARQPVRADAPAGGTKVIEMIGVNKWYGEFHVLKDIHLSVNKGEVVVVIGPSGSGKSTLIRCINRLE